jgi:hypothetical protein
MRMKLLALTAVLGITAFASSVPQAEAYTLCGSPYCATHPQSVCTCPEGTDLAGKPSNCRTWNQVGGTGCWLS